MGTTRARTLRGIVLALALAAAAPATAQQAQWHTTYRDSTTIFRGLDGADSLHFMIACWRFRENYVLASSDGGATWRRAFTDSARFVGGRWIYRPQNVTIAYPSRDVAVMVGDSGYVVTTGDGGQTWASQRVGSQRIEFLTMQDGRHGALSLLSTPNTLLATSDGGASWDTIPAAPPPAGDMKYVMALATPAPRAYLCLWQRAYTTLALTSDAGSTWEYIDRPFGDSIRRAYFSFIDARNGWAVASRWTEKGSLVGRTLIFRTTDGGRTWERQFDQPSVGPGPTDVEFIDELHGLVAGPREILRTTDGGSSWRLESDDRADGEFGDYYIAYPSPTKALIGVWTGGVLQMAMPGAAFAEERTQQPAAAPNPVASGQVLAVRVGVRPGSEARVDVTTTLGERIGQHSTTPESGVLSITIPSDTPAGLYFVRVIADGQAPHVIPIHVR